MSCDLCNMTRIAFQFLLSGDVFPPRERGAQAPLRFAPLDITMSPSFRVRGIQPFHDFTSGPDWWSGDDYKVVMTQLTKQKANFIGLHSYPGGFAEASIVDRTPSLIQRKNKCGVSSFLRVARVRATR